MNHELRLHPKMQVIPSFSVGEASEKQQADIDSLMETNETAVSPSLLN